MVHLVLSVTHIMRIPRAHHVSLLRNVANQETHYLEGGSGPTLVLLHSGEFGACAESTWEMNLGPLAEHFHVFAPDWLGYGRTSKIFDFENMWDARVRQIERFLQTLCVGPAAFMGNSMGGSMLCAVAAMERPAWQLRRIVIVSGGGHAPDTPARRVLTSYACTREQMRTMVKAMYFNPRFANDEDYIAKRYELSLVPGAWECTAAVRFRAAFRVPEGLNREVDYERISVPTLIVAGAHDNLRDKGYAELLQQQIVGSELHLFQNSGHFPQIDEPDLFNDLVIGFLKGRDSR